MAYVGRGIDNISNATLLNAITFTDSAGPYNLTSGSPAVAFTPISVQALVIQIDGVIQVPSSYTISSATITFDSVMAASSTNNFIVHNGVGLVTEPSDGAVTTAKIADDAVTTAKILDNNVTVAKLPTTLDISSNTVTLPATVAGLGTGLTNTQLQNNSITINSTSVPLGGSISNVGEETYPTITSLTPDTIENTATAVVIAGTNFVSVPQVEAINTSGAIVAADSVSFTSSTSITATFTLPVDGTYFVRVENNDGLAVRTSTAD